MSGAEDTNHTNNVAANINVDSKNALNALSLSSSVTVLTPQNSCLELTPHPTFHINITLSDIASSCITTVHGFIREALGRKTYNNIHQTIKDLIAYMYAKPVLLNLQYNKISKYILYCTINDSWHSIINKIMLEYKLNSAQNISKLQYDNGYLDHSGWASGKFTWTDNDIFTFETEAPNKSPIAKPSKAHTHKIVTLKCCIGPNGGEKKIKLPSKSWEVNLKSVLTRIPKKFAIVNKLEWLVQIDGVVVSKKDWKQFAKVLALTAPPAIIEIIEKRYYLLYVHYQNDKSFVYKALGSNCDGNIWTKATFNKLLSVIRKNGEIEYDFCVFADKRCRKYDIFGIDSLKNAFMDRYNLDVYIKHQVKVEYGSNSFYWKPTSSSTEDAKEWDDYYHHLKNTISNRFKLPFDEFEVNHTFSGCNIKSGKHLITAYQTLKTKSQSIKIKKTIFIKLTDIKAITYKHNRMGSAVTELQHKIPFIQKQTCYDIIMDAMNNHKQIKQPQPKQEQKENVTQWSSNRPWEHIANCAAHEMWSQLSHTIKSIVDQWRDNLITFVDTEINDKSMNNLLRELKFKKNLPKEEAEYLRKLIQRYRQFDNNIVAVHSWDGQDIDDEEYNKYLAPTTWKGLNISILNDIFNVHRAFVFSTYHFEEYTDKLFIYNINNNRFLGKDFTKKYLKQFAFAPQFNFYPRYLVQDDLFEIVKYFFAVSHYVDDIEKNGEIEPDENEKEYESDEEEEDDDDDEDEEIVYDDAENVENATEFRLYSVIIPKLTTCVYDNNLLFQPSIGNIDQYLLDKNIYNYHRNVVRLNKINNVNDIKQLLIKYYNVNDIKQDKSNKVMIIIDRRRLNQEINDILYIFCTKHVNQFSELQSNYFIGFDFYILFGHLKGNNVTKAYLRYGIGDKLRFYPELLESIMPRLFVKKRRFNAQAMYSNNYKHGFCLRLHDPVFNKYYKLITNFTFVSVNYNRNVVIDDYKEDNAEVLFFSDILSIQLAKDIQSKQVQQFKAYLLENDYDSDAIVFDLGEDEEISDLHPSFIKDYFFDNKQDKNWVICRDWIKKFNQRRSEEHDKKENTENIKTEHKGNDSIASPGSTAKCGKENIISIRKCPFVDCIIESLQIFQQLNFHVSNAKLAQFDLSYLSQSYDHIINVHEFCKKNRNVNDNDNEAEEKKSDIPQAKESLNEIKQYFYEKLGQCNDKTKCSVLLKHSNRKRERGADSEENKRKEKKENNKRERGEMEMGENDNGRGEADDGLMFDEQNENKNINDAQANLSEMINAILNSIHTYVLHAEWQLFRLQMDANDKGNGAENRFTTPTISVNKNKFTTPLSEGGGAIHRQETILDELDDSDEDEEANGSNKSTIYSINFGLSVLEWLQYGEKPKFKTFHHEIVNNPVSTVDEKLFLSFKQECFIKSITNKGEFYTIIELLSLKLYTDTTLYQSQLRKAFWTTSSKEVRKNFYLWALNLYKTQLYHAIPVPINYGGKKKGKPSLVYHGLNNVFIVDRSLPMYNGPISTTLDKSVALSFSDAKGLIWNIKCSYINPFKLIKGISVDWISQFKHEAEFLLINQYLPIDKTKNFTSDDSNNVDHLLYTLKATNNKITSPQSFYAQIGFKYKETFTAIIQKHSALYQATSIGRTISILQRLYEELGLKDEFQYEYKVISSKFKIYDHRNLHNLFRLDINDEIECKDEEEHKNDCFANCKYKMIAIDAETNNAMEGIAKITCKYDEEISIENNIKYKIYVKNKNLFLRKTYVLLQEIEAIEFEDEFSDLFYNNLQLCLSPNGVILNPFKSLRDKASDEEEDEYETEDEEEYESEDEYDVKQDIYGIISQETQNEILSAQFILKLSTHNFDDDIDEKEAQSMEVYECKNINNFIIPLNSLPAKANNIDTIHSYKLYVKNNNKNVWKLFKTFYFTEYIFNNPKNDILISSQLNINRVFDGGGSLQIFSKSSIIISANGVINANFCGFNNMALDNDEDDLHDLDIEEEEEENMEIEDHILKYGKAQPSDEDYDAVVFGGGIIELISEKNIINNGKIMTNGGTIKIFTKHDFINNGQILSTNTNPNDDEKNSINNGNVFIQCREFRTHEKSVIIPPPKIQNMNNKFHGFTAIQRVIARNAHKIKLSVRDKNGSSEHRTDPINLLSFDDNYYLSKDLKSKGIHSDWIIFEMENPHFITRVCIQNCLQKNGIKKIELFLANPQHVYAENKYWFKLTSIDKIKNSSQEQYFDVKCPIHINQIADDKLYLVKLKILKNYGQRKSNRFYQFQMYGKLIYDVIEDHD